MYYNLIFRISRAKIRVNVWTVRCGEVAISGGSNVHLYTGSFKTKSNRSEYVRKFSTPIH